jgi:hypothetical protein
MDKLLISVSQTAVIQAELAIEGCSRCCPKGAKVPFWKVLNSFRSYAMHQVEYILPVLGRCPKCRSGIDENMLVRPKWYLLLTRTDYPC